VYLDDIIIYYDTVDDHIRDVDEVLSMLREVLLVLIFQNVTSLGVG
jgi:hypothetical protein